MAERILVKEGSLCYGWYYIERKQLIVHTYTGEIKVISIDYLPYIHDIMRRLNNGEELPKFKKYVEWAQLEQLKRRLSNVEI